jgi:membrane fusion protein (multidrug efflux system)
MKKYNNRTVVLMAVLLMAAAMTLVLMIKRPGRVEWLALSSQTAFETVQATGRVAGSKVTPLSLLKSGIVDEIRCTPGQKVNAGDTLCALDNREEANRVARQKGEVSIAQIQLERMRKTVVPNAIENVNQKKVREEAARRNRDRSDTLFQQGSITGEQFDNVIQEYEVLKSQRIVAEAELKAAKTSELQLAESRLRQARLLFDEAKIALSRSFLCAPSDGKVVEVRVEKGELAVSGDALVIFLPSDTAMFIEVQVDEGEIGRIRAGQKARVQTASSNPVTFDGFVRDVIGKIDVERGSGKVILTIKSDNRLIADQTISAEIITGTLKDALVIEQRFSKKTPEGDFVFVKKEGRAFKTGVRLTAIGNGRFAVMEGLHEGDTLLEPSELSEGVKVRLSGI